MKLMSALTALLLAAAPAYAQTTIQTKNLPSTLTAASPSDNVVSDTTVCGTCLMTVAKILAVGTNSQNTWALQQTVNINNTSSMTQDTTALTGQLYSPNSTGAQIYAMLCPGCRPNGDAVRGVATATPGTTNTNTNGVAGYVLNTNASANGGQNSVALFGVGISAANGAQTWGINTNVTDNTNGFAASSGTGRVLYNEFDINVTSTATRVFGLVIQGGSVAVPAAATGVLVGNLNLAAAAAQNQSASVPWQQAFYSANGAATVGLYLGTTRLDSAANQQSQPLVFGYRNGSGAAGTVFMYAGINGEILTTATNFASLSDGAMQLGATNNSFSELFVFSVRYHQVLISQLPSCGATNVGQTFFVIDAQTPTVYANLSSGGGGYGMFATCFNTIWVSH